MCFEEMLVGELDWLGRLARRFYSNDEDAEDLLGETVCRIIENKDRYEVGSPFKPWAKTIMSNLFVTAYNRRKSVPMCPLDYECPHVCDSMPDSDAEISNLLSVIRRLAKKSVCVEAVRRYALGGLSYEEVANSMGVAVDVVRTRIATGRKIIKRVLGVDKN